MKVLGIDYGKKRIGLAISDTDCIFAFPKEILKNDEKLLARIGEIVKEEKVKEIVIGESLDFKGEPNKVMKEIEKFSEKLKKLFSIPVYFEKEFLTTVEARRYTEDSKNADGRASALILQRYLDRIKKL